MRSSVPVRSRSEPQNPELSCARDAVLDPAGFPARKQANTGFVDGSLGCVSPGLVLYLLSVSFASLTVAL